MMMLPCAFWPLAEHASFGQNCFDASIGSVSVCICYSMPMDACFFNHSFPFHRIVGFYQPFRSSCRGSKCVGERGMKGRNSLRPVGCIASPGGRNSLHLYVPYFQDSVGE